MLLRGNASNGAFVPNDFNRLLIYRSAAHRLQPIVTLEIVPDSQPASKEAILDEFRQTGAYLSGHFLLTSGLHSPEFFQSAKALQYPALAELFARQIHARLLAQFPDSAIDAVCAPAMGGLIIGHEVARAFGVRFIFTERDPATREMSLRRGFSVTPGERVLIVEDVVTTGGSMKEVSDLLQAAGAQVLAGASIVDRSGGNSDIGIPRIALATVHATTYPPDACPLCAQGLPAIKPGSRPPAPKS